MALKVLSALETSKITVPAPSDTTDAATKQYVDSNSGGGGGSVDLSSIVPAFSSSQIYALGAVVSYNGKFYKCTTAVSSAGEFTPASWTEISLSSNKTVVLSGITKVTSTTIANELLPIASGSGDDEDAGLIPVLDANGALDGIYFPYATSDDYGVVKTGTGNGSGDSGKVAKLDSQSRVVGFNNHRQYLSPITLTTSARTLQDQYNGWRLLIKSTIIPGTLTLPTPSLTTNMCATYELYVVCMGSQGSVTLSFSNAISFEDGTSSSISLERGYAYFIVARTFPCLTATSTDSTQSWSMKWVYNLQGRIALPTS